MNHLKKILFGLAVAVTLVLVGANNASANCQGGGSGQVNSSAATLRAEGTTELTAIIALNCGAASATSGSFATTISNVTIVFAPTTTKVTPGGGTTTISAVAFPGVAGAINGFAQAAAAAGWSAACGGTPDNRVAFPCPTISSTLAAPLSAPIVTISGNTVNFSFTPGAGSAAAQTFYLTGLRVNVSSSGLTTGGVISAAVFTDGGVGSQQFSNVVFGIVQPTLNPINSGINLVSGVAQPPIAIAACGPAIKTPLGTPAVIAGNPDTSAGFANSLHVSLQEGFGGAFETSTSPAVISALGPSNGGLDGGFPAETTPVLVFPPGTPGTLGAFGLRIRVSLTGIPTGLIMYAPEQIAGAAQLGAPFVNAVAVGGVSAAGTGSVTSGTAVVGGGATVLTLVTGNSLDGSGGSPLGASVANQFDLITPTGGSASLVYEVTSNPGPGLELVAFNIPITGTGTVGVGSMSGVVSLSPIGPPTSNQSLPEFAALTKPAVVATSTICATYLVFPWIVTTNDGNFDTGIAIANTTSDPSVIGTVGQTGDVTLYLYPSDGSAATTQSLATGLKPGQTTTFVASSLKKPFQGYGIAVCGFHLGHGFAFIDNPIAGQNGFAEGYLALSVTSPRLGGVVGTFESAGH